jgi:hypothetical protein
MIPTSELKGQSVLTILDDLYKSQSSWLHHIMTIRFGVMPTVPKHIKHCYVRHSRAILMLFF